MALLTLAAASGAADTIARDLLAVLATAALSAVAMQRLRLAAIPAYLIAALRLVGSPENLASISHLAIILLLFGIGLQLHISVLRHGFVRMILSGVTACGLCTLVGWPIALGFGLPAAGALAVSMALALSSTAVVLRILSDRRELHRVTGRLALAILVVQDMVVLIMLAALPTLARWTAGPAAPAAASPVLWRELLLDETLRIGGAVLLIAIGLVLLPRIVRESARGRSLEVMMITSVAVALGAAVVAARLGFSLEMGAFLAGFLLARTPFRHQISGQIAPLRDLFIAVFFTTLGMKVNAPALMSSWWIVLLAAAVLLAAKGVLIAVSCWSFGATAGVACCVGAFLAQGGEFSLIVLDAAYGLDLLGDEALGAAIAVVVLSLIVTPALIQLGNSLTGRRIAARTAPWIRTPRFGAEATATVPAEEAVARAIVAGFGPAGRAVIAQLTDAGVHCTVVELNPSTVRDEARAGTSIVFGDVGNPEVLESAGLASADVLVMTMPDEEAAARAAAVARRRNPALLIATRVHAVSHIPALKRAGADCVVADESATAEALLAALHKRLGGQQAASDPLLEDPLV